MSDNQIYKLGKEKLYITDNFGYVHEADCDEFNIEFISDEEPKEKNIEETKTSITFYLDIQPFPINLKGVIK